MTCCYWLLLVLVAATAPKHGVSGPLYPLLNASALKEFVSSPPSTSFIVVLANELFTPGHYEALNGTERVAAIVVTYDEALSDAATYSPDNQYPNGAARAWNGAGTQPGFMYQPMRVPIVGLRNANVSQLLADRAADNAHRQWAFPQWGARVKLFMSAAGDAATCLRRGFCQPLGGQSVWAARRPLRHNNATATRPVVMLSAALDSTALLQDAAVGARANMAALLVALAVVDALQTVNDSVWDAAPRQPAFAFFTGEAWDNMGSRRFFRDVASFRCARAADKGDACAVPYAESQAFTDLKLDDIDFLLHLDAMGVGGHDAAGRAMLGSGELYWHDGGVGGGGAAASALRAELQRSLVAGVRTGSVPDVPPSALAVARERRGELPGAVLAGYDAHFAPNYHSEWDDGRNVDPSTLCVVATSVARALLQSVAAPSATHAGVNVTALVPHVAANCTLVMQLWECLVDDALCPLLRRTLPQYVHSSAADAHLLHPTHYVGVHKTKNVARGYWAPFVRAFAAWRLRRSENKACTSSRDCATAEQCVMSHCVLASVYFHDALPDGLDFDYVSNEYVFVNDSSPGAVWVESNWDRDIGIELFRVSDERAAWAFLAFGVLLTGASFGGLIYSRRVLTKRYKLL